MHLSEIAQTQYSTTPTTAALAEASQTHVILSAACEAKKLWRTLFLSIEQ